jgi:predicted XRE-type DNA-binding protein
MEKMRNQRKKTYNGEIIEPSSGNVFSDLGLPNPAERERKAMLAEKIAELIKENKLTQRKAGELLGVDQTKISKLVCGRLSGFSVSSLLDYLTALDQDIEIVVKPKESTKKTASIYVTLTEGVYA